jgi:predicted metalloendopeptidase
MLNGVMLAAKTLDAKCLTLSCQQAAKGVLNSMDTRANPCEDFYQFSCGNFEKTHPIPQGNLIWENFLILQEVMDKRSRAILNEAVTPQDPAAVIKAKNMYAACMDTDSLDRRGLKSVVDLLRNWGGWPVLNSDWTPLDWQKMGDIVAEFAVPFIFSISTLPNLDNANTTAVYLDAPSLVLPSPLLQHLEVPDMLKELSKLPRSQSSLVDLPFTKYLVKMATILRDHLQTNASDEAIQKDMVDVLLFMQGLSAASQNTKETNADINSRGMAWTIEQLNQWTKENLEGTRMDWVQFLQRAYGKSGVEVKPEHPVIFLAGEKSLGGVIQFIERADPRVLVNYVMSRLLVFLSPESNKEMRDAAFEFYVRQGYITPNYTRWLYCLHKVQDYPNVGFSHAVAYEYKKNMEDPRILKEADDMVSDLRDAFHNLLAENEWMDDATRQSAAQKADAILVLLGFPSWCHSSAQLDDFYQDIEVDRDDHFGNVARLRSWVQNTNLANLGKARNRNEWTQSPLVVNAFYNSLNNRITFPVGIMDVPFFSGNTYEKLLDYARIGAIVGHEITHGFDSLGRQYDAFGSAYIWWSNETNAKFQERAQCFVDQYSRFTVTELNKTVNGQMTLRENIADNGGIREAYRAFKKLKARRGLDVVSPRLPGLERYSPDQLFFIGYATMWCRAETLAGLNALVQTDSHSPNRFRVIGSLSNMEEFSRAFRCPLGSGMNPVNKCVLW